MLRLTGGKAAAILLGFGLATLTVAYANADKVGVAAAVHPDAFSGGTEINIGKAIFFNERINTSAQGLVQVLLLDGSTFTIGPGSDLVIDKYVYDPHTNQGQMTANFSKGVMRFIGGKISKNGGVSIKTPEGALAIRGSILDAKVGGPNALFCFQSGINAGINYKGQVYNLQPGEKFSVRGGVGTTGPITPEDVRYFTSALSLGKAKALAHGEKSRPGRPAIKGSQTEDAIKNDAAYTRILNELANQNPAGGSNSPGPPVTVGPPPPPPPPPPPTLSGPPYGWGVGGTPPCPNCSGGPR